MHYEALQCYDAVGWQQKVANFYRPRCNADCGRSSNACSNNWHNFTH